MLHVCISAVGRPEGGACVHYAPACQLCCCQRCTTTPGAAPLQQVDLLPGGTDGEALEQLTAIVASLNPLATVMPCTQAQA